LPVESDTVGGHGIGTLNEGWLHAALKAWYAREGDELEAVVDGYVIDIVRHEDGGERLIEIQTGSFADMRDKLHRLVPEHRVLLVHPIPRVKWIAKVAPPENGDREKAAECMTEYISRRRSPKHGQSLDVFDELVRIPRIVGHANLSLDVVMCQVDEIRCDDGRGSWRRKGVSILGQRLLKVDETIRLAGPDDLAALLPGDLADPFTNRDLARAAAIRLRLAQRVTYCLRKLSVVAQKGKRGRAHLYHRV